MVYSDTLSLYPLCPGYRMTSSPHVSLDSSRLWQCLRRFPVFDDLNHLKGHWSGNLDNVLQLRLFDVFLMIRLWLQVWGRKITVVKYRSSCIGSRMHAVNPLLVWTLITRLRSCCHVISTEKLLSPPLLSPLPHYILWKICYRNLRLRGEELYSTSFGGGIATYITWNSAWEICLFYHIYIFIFILVYLNRIILLLKLFQL